MKGCIKLAFMLIYICVITVPMYAYDSKHSLGFGLHYFYILEDISEDWEFHDDGLGFYGAYCFNFASFAGVQFEIQAYPDGYFDAESAYSPGVLLLLGRGVYGGIGAYSQYMKWDDTSKEIKRVDGEWTDISFLIRAGLMLPILFDTLNLDIHAQYNMNSWSEIELFDHEFLTFGAGIRVQL
ncbi:hypothetical protein JW979_06770 [bacterium]|nr:hypothetical protein [candidate division CSSED10-310 bacterium]